MTRLMLLEVLTGEAFWDPKSFPSIECILKGMPRDLKFKGDVGDGKTGEDGIV